MARCGHYGQRLGFGAYRPDGVGLYHYPVWEGLPVDAQSSPLPAEGGSSKFGAVIPLTGARPAEKKRGKVNERAVPLLSSRDVAATS